MTIDFQDAAKRHYGDACLLKTHGRNPNSGQLFGVSAECGLKALLVCLKYPIEANGDLQRRDQFKKHINQLVLGITTLQIWIRAEWRKILGYAAESQ